MENREFKVGLFMLPLLTQGGGAEKYFIELARGLRKREIKADVVTMDEKFFQKFARLLHILTRGNFFGKINTGGRESEDDIARQLGTARWIKADLKNLEKVLEEYDVIYAKNELVDLALLKLKGYKKLPPIIVGAHTPILYPEAKSSISRIHNLLYSSYAYKWLLLGTSLVHVVNSDDEKLLAEKFKSCAVKKIYYPFSVQNGAACRSEREEGLRIIFIGRLSEQKGVDIFIKLVEEINRSGALRDIEFRVAGSGDAYFEKRMKNLEKEQPNLSYLGHVSHKDIGELYRWGEITILPSRYETVNYVALETGGSGKIAVASDIPGLREVIENKQTGFLLPLSVEEFYSKIEELYHMKKYNSSEFYQIGMNARKYIENKFSADRIFSAMVKMLEECREK
ncbi:MAG: glycosyltransferase family 4 protein [Parcubacteria group bacterium]|jgi:glycosyltransferase involved in cell wall biosynthesis